MVNNHGDDAAQAAATADEWLAKGNFEVQSVWLRIAKAIDELQSVKDDETKH